MIGDPNDGGSKGHGLLAHHQDAAKLRCRGHGEHEKEAALKALLQGAESYTISPCSADGEVEATAPATHFGVTDLA
jgi:hypothetical protein